LLTRTRLFGRVKLAKGELYVKEIFPQYLELGRSFQLRDWGIFGAEVERVILRLNRQNRPQKIPYPLLRPENYPVFFDIKAASLKKILGFLHA
jgi:hypothetical protein